MAHGTAQATGGGLTAVWRDFEAVGKAFAEEGSDELDGMLAALEQHLQDAEVDSLDDALVMARYVHHCVEAGTDVPEVAAASLVAGLERLIARFGTLVRLPAAA